jgi:serine/threonine protein kinase
LTLAAGIRFGSYEVIALIGAGRIGEVYRARDTKLNRGVALKILAALEPSEQRRHLRLRRYRRHARPRAATGRSSDTRESHRASHVPLNEALPIAKQIDGPEYTAQFPQSPPPRVPSRFP